jgi:hypothetical protein
MPTHTQTHTHTHEGRGRARAREREGERAKEWERASEETGRESESTLTLSLLSLPEWESERGELIHREWRANKHTNEHKLGANNLIVAHYLGTKKFRSGVNTRARWKQYTTMIGLIRMPSFRCVCVCVCARVSPSLLLTTSAPFCFCSLCRRQGSFCLPIQSEYGARYDRYIRKKKKPGEEAGINMLKKHRSVRIDYLKKKLLK